MSVKPSRLNRHHPRHEKFNTGDVITLPVDMLREKWQPQVATAMDASDVKLHAREALMDYSCDPRSTEEQARRWNTQATDKINVRTSGWGSRSGLVPRHPELFLDNLARDPGGFVPGDMSKLPMQYWGRKEYFQSQLYSDADNSIPSDNRSDYEDRVARDEMFHNVKDRVKYFQTSYDFQARSANYTGGNPLGALKDRVDNHLALNSEEKMIDSEVLSNNKATIALSNYVRSDGPFRQNYGLPDHLYPVGEYGNLLYTSTNLVDPMHLMTRIENNQYLMDEEDYMMRKNAILALERLDVINATDFTQAASESGNSAILKNPYGVIEIDIQRAARNIEANGDYTDVLYGASEAGTRSNIVDAHGNERFTGDRTQMDGIDYKTLTFRNVSITRADSRPRSSDGDSVMATGYDQVARKNAAPRAISSQSARNIQDQLFLASQTARARENVRIGDSSARPSASDESRIFTEEELSQILKNPGLHDGVISALKHGLEDTREIAEFGTKNSFHGAKRGRRNAVARRAMEDTGRDYAEHNGRSA